MKDDTKNDAKQKTILIAADHAGFELKNALGEHLRAAGYTVEDMGNDVLDPEDDYPAVMVPVGMRITEDPENLLAIIFGGSGQGEAMTVNRFPGVRAVVYYGGGEGGGESDMSIIRLSREHNDANVLSIGARFVTREQMFAAADLWLSTPFSGEERHERRIEQIDSIS